NGVVAFAARDVEELLCVGEPGGDRGEPGHGVVERLLLAAQLLGLLLVAPDAGVGEELLYDLEALPLAVEVKDTSAARPTASAARRASRRSG
ncbi:MAG TPA: hypothetical protein VI229_03820, partial [Burkholderiales bacterium]